jgi:hypothetical protein
MVMATPLDRTSMTIIGTVFFLLLVPVLILKHHAFLIVSINAFVNAYFLPGQPQLWLIAVAVSSFFAVLTITLNRSKIHLLNIPAITWSLILLFLVTFITAQMTGGVGARAFGSGQFGGRRYFYLWGAIVVYFAISAFPIPTEKRKLYAALFFLSALTSIVSNLAYALGPNFYFLYLLFPPELALFQAAADDYNTITRLNGLSPATLSLIFYMFVRYGWQGILQIKHFWRGLLLLLTVILGLYSGYRSIIVLLAIIFTFQFLLEGLHRTRYLVVAIFLTLLLAGIVVTVANRLPLSVQRCLTILPLDLDATAVEDARGSTEWRLEMWRAILPDVPKYLWLGKGFSIDPKDLYFAQEGVRFGGATGYAGAIVAGDYHSGPLTLIIPFGIWGVFAFVFFLCSSLRVLYLNFKNSESEMKRINTFLFCYFLSKLTFFILIFGAFYLDLVHFTATVALSISLNRGVRTAFANQPVLEPESASRSEMEAALQPA